MKCLWCRHPTGRYPIRIGVNILAELGRFLARHPFSGKVYVVTDPSVWARHGPRVARSFDRVKLPFEVIDLPEGEESKSLPTIETLYDRLLAAGVERGTALVAFGGGVVGDVTGFVAATLLRGLPFVQVPTTLVGQADSAIGGKTGVDHPRGKNLIGAFHHPILVLSDLSLLATLPDREWRAGMAEVVKSAVVGSPALFRFLERKGSSLSQHAARLMTTVVEQAAVIKALLVERDPFDRGARLRLNLGHTLGHALEYATDCACRHGEAVSIGMVAACRLAGKLRLASAAVEERVTRLLDLFGLPVRVPRINFSTLENALRVDKKREGGAVRVVVPREIGRVVTVNAVPIPLIRDVVRELTEVSSS